MACDQARLVAHPAAAPVTHPDTDYRSGHSVQIRCDTAPMYVGGASVSNTNGYLVPAGQTFGLNDSEDLLYFCVDPANDNAVVYAFWAGV